MDNGGIFMDWIHPFEVAFYSTGCRFGKILSARDFIVNESYSGTSPTGVESVIGIGGDNYIKDAIMTTRVAKGTAKNFAKKAISLEFESGAVSVLAFPGHESEFNDSTKRGGLSIFENGKLVSTKEFSGPNSSEIFIKEIFEFCNGRNPGLKLQDIDEIFKPQWEYQSMKRPFLTDRMSVYEFLNDG